MRTFDSLSEQEVLALAISLEEEDARIYEDFADGLQENYPEQAGKFRAMRRDEDGHRHRLLEHYKSKFGDHVPLIRRQDVRGFVDRKPVWLVRPLGLKAVQKTAESMEVETMRFYAAACKRTTDTGIRQLLGDLAEEERGHAHTAEQIAHTCVEIVSPRVEMGFPCVKMKFRCEKMASRCVNRMSRRGDRKLRRLIWWRPRRRNCASWMPEFSWCAKLNLQRP